MTDQTAAPRPVPTFADRTAALEELRAERVKTGRLEGDLRSQTRVVAELTAEREHMELNPTGTAEWLKNRVNELTAERDAARNDAKQAAQTAAFRQGVIDRHRQELGAAGEVLAVVRDAVERIDRALATYDTTPGEAPEREDGRPERVAEDIAAAIETHFLPDDLTAIQAARIARHHATQYGQAPSSVPSRRAQEPGALMNRRAVVSDALGRALTARGYDVPLPVRDRCAEAVLAAQDAARVDRAG